MREKFEDWRPARKTLNIVGQADAIMRPMRADGYRLTIRQLFYQFVQRGLLENTPQNYEKLGYVMQRARMAGLIDWDDIEDRTRFIRERNQYNDQANFIDRLIENEFVVDVWSDQPTYCEVWIEKDALIGVIERECWKLRVPYLACRGYNSASELYSAGRRFNYYRRQGKRCVVFHLGDHDPSGIHMTAENDEALTNFTRSTDVEVIRLGLNMDQVREYDPPPNTAKETDSRTAEYVERFGSDDCWELDALAPQVIGKLVNDAIEGVIDRPLYDAALAREEALRAPLREVGKAWQSVERFIRYRGAYVPYYLPQAGDVDDLLRDAEKSDIDPLTP